MTPLHALHTPQAYRFCLLPKRWVGVQVLLQQLHYIKPLRDTYGAALSLLRDFRRRLVPAATAALLATAVAEQPIDAMGFAAWRSAGSGSDGTQHGRCAAV